jgi:hypothetical protein
MRISRRRWPAFAGVLFSLFLLACGLVGAASADAAGPATVTVRVEGTTETLVPPTEVTTTTSPVVKDGNPAHSCLGTSAAGALELATSGNWNGAWFSGLDYSVETIGGESHLFEEGAATNYFWSFWHDNAPATTGVCQTEVSSGDSILFFPECFSETNACPPAPNPLGITAPGVAEAGSPITVAVTSYANATGAPSPAVGATVTAGNASATTDASGHATLALAGPGLVVLHASAPGSVRTEATVCIHKGNDGNCGTSASGAGGSSGGGTTTAPPGQSPSTAITAHIGSLLDGHVYASRRAPRILAGTVTSAAPLQEVQLRLTRRGPKGRCSYFEGLTGRFRAMRCGAANGRYFKASSQKLFSYLLPEALAAGRYVLDVQGVGAGGQLSSLVRGASRIVFYVK